MVELDGEETYDVFYGGMVEAILARRLFPDAPNHRLGTLVGYRSIANDGTFHRALADSEMTAALWLDMLLVLEMARKSGSPVPLAATANEMMNACRGLGIDGNDFETPFANTYVLRRQENSTPNAAPAFVDEVSDYLFRSLIGESAPVFDAIRRSGYAPPGCGPRRPDRRC